MIAIQVFDGGREKTMETLKRLYMNGLIAFGCGKDPMKIRFLLPAILSDSDVKCAKKIIEKTRFENCFSFAYGV